MSTLGIFNGVITRNAMRKAGLRDDAPEDLEHELAVSHEAGRLWRESGEQWRPEKFYAMARERLEAKA